MYKVIGIDEAGKGPVIGSMYIAFAIIVLDEKDKLDEYQDKLKNELGVRDSKLIAPKKRREIYNQLNQYLDIKFLQLTPNLIDHNNDKGGKLNQLEIDAIVNLLEQEKPQLVIIDALTADPKKFAEDIKSKLNFECKFISENKADTKYPLVGAASIIAKELRELEVEQAKKSLNVDFGSGYPSDPKTVEFLKKNFAKVEYDFLFRKSWATYKNLIKKEVSKKLDEYL